MARPYVTPLRTAGFRVVAFDMPGHGASPGDQSDFESFCDALGRIAEQFGPLAGVVAHSLGVPAAVQMLRAATPCKGFVGLGPIVWLETLPQQFAETLGLSGALRAKFFEHLFATCPRMTWQTHSLLGPVHDVADHILFVHDRDDREAHWTGSVAAARHWRRAALELTSGLGHRRIVSAPAVVARVVQFLVDANA